MTEQAVRLVYVRVSIKKLQLLYISTNFAWRFLQGRKIYSLGICDVECWMIYNRIFDVKYGLTCLLSLLRSPTANGRGIYTVEQMTTANEFIINRFLDLNHLDRVCEDLRSNNSSIVYIFVI